ncbi:hypothetical protein Tco_0040619 [Tanacetum coccineum]
MAYTSNSSGSDTEKNEVVYKEKIAVLEFEVKDKSNAITRLKNYQLSAKDKTSLGYGDQLNENDSSGSELFNIVLDSRSSDGDDNQTNDRFKKDNGYHAIPFPLTGNYMPPLADLSFAGLDDYVYRPTENKSSASVSQVEASITLPSNTSVEMPRVESVRPTPNTSISNEIVITVRVKGVNTAGQIAVSVVKGNRVTAIKASAGCVWRPKMTDLNNVSKYNSGSWVSKRVNYIDPQGRLKHMTRNKDFFTDYQVIDGGFVAFGGGTRGGKITADLAGFSLLTDQLNSSTMADLAFVQQHNMVAYLEKNDGNAYFHQILDFLTSSSVNFALTAVVVSESSMRRDLHLNDEDGTACLTVNEIFENLALMGYETASDKLTFYKVATATASQPPKDPNTCRRTKRGRNTKVPQSGGSLKKVGDEAINEDMLDSVERAITTDASLDAAQDSDNITKTQSTVTLNEPHPQGEGSEGHTSGSEEGGCSSCGDPRTKEKIQEIRKTKEVKHVTTKEGGNIDIDFDGFDDETVDATTTGVSIASAPVTTTGVAISTVEPRTPPTTTTVFDDKDVTIAMAQTLIKMKEEKAKENGIAFKDVKDSFRPVRSITTLQPLLFIDPKDKGKGILVKGEPDKAEFEGYKKKKRQKKFQGCKSMKSMDTIQARIDVMLCLLPKLQKGDSVQYTI